VKTGKTLEQLGLELKRQRAAKRDFIATTDSMSMTVRDGERFRLFNEGQMHMDGPQEFGMTSLFHRQLGASVGIPAAYYDKMREKYPELLAGNVNAWLGREPSRHMIRTLDGAARAYLSDRYRRIDHWEIAETVLPLIGEMNGARFDSCEITDRRMYIKVVNTRLEAEVRKGDVVQAGIVISNSEVGVGSVSVQPLVYRLACMNGMIIADMGKRKYHVGRVADEEYWELFSDDTLRADDAAFMLKLADIVRTAVDEAQFAVVVERLQQAANAPFAGWQVPVVMELTAKQYGLSKNEQGGILDHLIGGGDLTRWGLSSAVTRAAQDVDDYDRSTELEGIGWQIAALGGEEWRDLQGVTV